MASLPYSKKKSEILEKKGKGARQENVSWG